MYIYIQSYIYTSLNHKPPSLPPKPPSKLLRLLLQPIEIDRITTQTLLRILRTRRLRWWLGLVQTTTIWSTPTIRSLMLRLRRLVLLIW